MTEITSLNPGVELSEIKLGATYQVSDNTSYWNHSFGKCIAVHADRRIATLKIDGSNVDTKPEELRFVCN